MLVAVELESSSWRFQRYVSTLEPGHVLWWVRWVHFVYEGRQLRRVLESINSMLASWPRTRSSRVLEVLGGIEE